MKGLISGGLAVAFFVLLANNRAKGRSVTTATAASSGGGNSNSNNSGNTAAATPTTSRRLVFPNADGEDRNCDPAGCGHFGAPRGSRRHKGHDFIVVPGQQVISPINGKVLRYAYPYASDLSYKGILIEGRGVHAGFQVKIFYMNPTIGIGETVDAHQVIGIAQNVAAKYPGSEMQPHLHLELYVNGEAVDPRPYFG